MPPRGHAIRENSPELLGDGIVDCLFDLAKIEFSQIATPTQLQSTRP
jgi:hypothetical protein